MAKNKSLWIDGIVGSQLRDTQGEMLSVEGADISELEAGRGRWNDNHSKGFYNTLGRITEAKKIYKAEDCENDRHRYFWDKVKAPFIYAKGYLFDDSEHPNAKAAAAVIRNMHKTDCPLKVKASVEGGVIARGIADPTLLARTKIHSVAITLTPANQATLIEPIGLKKSSQEEIEADMILIKSVMHLAETNVPSFRHIERVASAEKIRQKMETIESLMKEVDDPSLKKNWKNVAATAAALGALSGAPSKISPEPAVERPQAQAAIAPKDIKPSMSPSQLIDSIKAKDPILYSIAHVESSGGKNLNHETMERGMHKGHTAGGPWGLMPKTVAYIFGVNKKLADKYPKIKAMISDIDGNHEKITARLNNDPKASYEISKALFKHLKSVHSGDIDKAVHSWHYGINGTKKAIEGGQNITDADYVKKFHSKYKDLSKSLNAGYGGAGAPVDLTGGGVMQSESMNVGKGFKYINCDHCGHEQIFHKYQAKCRNKDCGKSFSLEKLYRAMTGKAT